MKKYYLLRIVVIITLLFGIYTFFNQREQRQNRDESFIFELEQVQSFLAMDYSKMSENDKTFYYMKTSSDLYAALTMSKFTSYNNIKNSHELLDALNSLYLYISNYDKFNDRWNDITFDNSALICKYLHNISINPNDKNSCESLSKLIQSFYKK